MKHINSETIMAYYDGELSEQESSLVERHLENCPECSRELESFRKTAEMISILPVTRTGIAPAFTAVKAGAAAGRRITPGKKWYIRLHNRIRPILATAAALIVVLTVLFLNHRDPVSGDDFKAETCMVEQETDAIVQGYDSLPQYYN